MKNTSQKKRYDTQEKRKKFIRKKGNIITFKKPFYPGGTADGSRDQIVTNGIEKDPSGAIKIIGLFYDSNWYQNFDELLDAINWDWMEKAHSC
jgi:hypothetical protein